MVELKEARLGEWKEIDFESGVSLILAEKIKGKKKSGSQSTTYTTSTKIIWLPAID